jgi:hypothetical protein
MGPRYVEFLIFLLCTVSGFSCNLTVQLCIVILYHATASPYMYINKKSKLNLADVGFQVRLSQKRGRDSFCLGFMSWLLARVNWIGASQCCTQYNRVLG